MLHINQESIKHLLQKVDDLKNKIDSFTNKKQEDFDRVMQKLRLEWNYNSNAIEGNQLDYGETVSFLMHGLTAKGKGDVQASKYTR